MNLDSLLPYLGEWLRGTGPESDVVVSTRIRLARNLADFALLAGTEDDHLAGLTGRVAPAPVVRVPFLDTDVHDLDGLDRIAAHLFQDAARRAAG